MIQLNQLICNSLHNFTGNEVIKLRIFSNQLKFLPSFRLCLNLLKEKLYFFQRNKNLKKFYFESLETLYFSLATFGYGNASLVSNLISYMLENMRKHTLITKFLKKLLHLFFTEINPNFLAVSGIRILIKGRFNKRRRTKTIVVQEGQISLQTLSKMIDYHQSQAVTIYGTFGIKVWLIKKTLKISGK